MPVSPGLNHLLAVPNVSAGVDRETIDAVGVAFSSGGAQLVDVHSDPDHGRSVYTLHGTPAQLVESLVAGARTAIELIDLPSNDGVHPNVGALDVVPIVYLERQLHGLAAATALVVAERLGSELALPCFTYGTLAADRSRAELRRGSTEELSRRVERGELRPDFGPCSIDPKCGATLIAARPPLIAFNVNLKPPTTVETAKAIAAKIREGGECGLIGLRAIGLDLRSQQIVQISTNIEDHEETSPGEVVSAVSQFAEVDHVELIGIAPALALKDFPEEVEIIRFDPARHIIENVVY